MIVDFADSVYGSTPLPTDPVQYTKIVEINQAFLLVDVRHGASIRLSVDAKNDVGCSVWVFKNGVWPDRLTPAFALSAMQMMCALPDEPHTLATLPPTLKDMCNALKAKWSAAYAGKSLSIYQPDFTNAVFKLVTTKSRLWTSHYFFESFKTPLDIKIVLHGAKGDEDVMNAIQQEGFCEEANKISMIGQGTYFTEDIEYVLRDYVGPVGPHARSVTFFVCMMGFSKTQMLQGQDGAQRTFPNRIGFYGNTRGADIYSVSNPDAFPLFRVVLPLL